MKCSAWHAGRHTAPHQMLNRLTLAGRVAPGICFRLWSETTSLQEATPPDILNADLAPLALQLAQWGCPDGRDLLWLDPPQEHSMEAAQQLLRGLGAVDGSGLVTSQGQHALKRGRVRSWAMLIGLCGLWMATGRDEHGWHHGLAVSWAVLSSFWPSVSVLSGLRFASGEQPNLVADHKLWWTA